MFDRPVQGRVFFEEVIRENVDIGRPDHVQLIFDRRVTRRTPSRCRVITEGVTPSLHVDYKHSRIKQYHKEGRALRTETVVNDTYDFGIGRRLCNLDALKQIGFAANRRLLCVQRMTAFLERISSINSIGPPLWTIAVSPPYASENLAALLSVLLAFRLLPAGFANRQLREHAASLMGLSTTVYSSNRATYDLRRLRLRGLTPPTLTSLPRNRNRNENCPMLSTDPSARSQSCPWCGLR